MWACARRYPQQDLVCATGDLEPPGVLTGKCRSRDFTDPLRPYEVHRVTLKGFMAWLKRSFSPFPPPGLRHNALPTTGIMVSGGGGWTRPACAVHALWRPCKAMVLAMPLQQRCARLLANLTPHYVSSLPSLPQARNRMVAEKAAKAKAALEILEEAAGVCEELASEPSAAAGDYTLEVLQRVQTLAALSSMTVESLLERAATCAGGDLHPHGSAKSAGVTSTASGTSLRSLRHAPRDLAAASRRISELLSAHSQPRSRRRRSGRPLL
jgi:hypothetical protein